MSGSCLIGPCPAPGGGSRKPPTESQAKLIEASSGIFSFTGACAVADIAQAVKPQQSTAPATPRQRLAERQARVTSKAVTIRMFLAQIRTSATSGNTALRL